MIDGAAVTCVAGGLWKEFWGNCDLYNDLGYKNAIYVENMNIKILIYVENGV